MVTFRSRHKLKLLSKSQMDEQLYESELLPEIEIREIMSLEELMTMDTSFVAFSENEILQYMSQLVEDTHRGKVFHRLFQQLRSLPEHPSTQYVIPILDTEVANHEDNQYEILQAIVDTNNAPNYISQLNEIYKLTYPLSISLDAPPPHLPSSVTPITVGIEGNLSKTYVLLPRDIAYAKQSVIGSAYRIPLTTQSSYLHERANAPEMQRLETEIVLGKMPHEMIPDFNVIVDRIDSITDLHTLRVYLERFGYDIDRLSQPKMETLIAKLRTLPIDSETEDKKSNSRSRASPPSLALTSRASMWKMFEDMLQHRLDADKFLAMWEMLPSTTQLVAPAIEVPKDIAEIALGVADGKFTLDDVVASLKYQHDLAEYQQVRKLLEDFQSFNAEEAQTNLATMMEKWNIVFAPYTDRMPESFLTEFQELAEIKAGADTSTYLGDPQRVYHDEEHDTIAAVADTDDDPDAYAEVNAEVATRIDPLPIPLHSMSEGAREILQAVLPKIQRIQRASGVPCNFQALVNSLVSKIVRVSRKEYIDANVMGLSMQVRDQIIHMDFDTAIHTASMILPTELSAQLQDVVKMAWNVWEEDTITIFYESFAWWILDIQENALDRTLMFDVTQGSFACLPKWSPWGPPLQADKGEGVLEYLVCVAHDLQIITSSTDAMKRKLLEIIEAEPRTATLKSRFREIGKDVPIMTDRAKAANMSLAEAIENKQKSRYLPEFVKTYMLLPGLLTGQPRLSSGCCLQKIGADFNADSDWRGVLKRLRDVKDAFAKKRMTMIEMPHLALYERPAPSVADATTDADAFLPTPIPPIVNIQMEDWLMNWDMSTVTFVSKELLRLTLRDANQAMAQAEKFLQMAKATARLRMDIFEFLKEKASWTHFDQIINIILLNLQQTCQKSTVGSRQHTILQLYLSEVVMVKRHFQSLHGVWDDIDVQILRPLLTHVIARAVCLPAIPETSNTNQLVMSETVATGFLSNTIKSVLEKLKKYIAVIAMPTMEEQAAFITDMREQQKVQVLSFLDEKNVDDRQLHMDMKKLGLTTFAKRPEPVASATNEEPPPQGDADYEAEGEREFTYRGVDADNNGINDLD